MKVRINLVDGNYIEVDTPADFDFIRWVMYVRDTGRWLHPDIYVPMSSVLSILRTDDRGEPVRPSPITGSVH